MTEKKDSCQLCNKKYKGFITSEHICKRCLRSVCRECAEKKTNIFMAVMEFKVQEHRVCNHCWEDKLKIEEYLENNQVVFWESSLLGRQWSNLYCHSTKHIANPFQNKKVPFINYKKIYSLLPSSYRNIIGLALMKKTKNVNLDAIFESIHEKVVKEIFWFFPIEKGMDCTEEELKGLVQIVLFIIMHTNMEECIQICKEVGKMMKRNQLSQLVEKYQRILEKQSAIPLIKGGISNNQLIKGRTSVKKNPYVKQTYLCKFQKNLGFQHFPFLLCSEFINQALIYNNIDILIDMQVYMLSYLDYFIHQKTPNLKDQNLCLKNALHEMANKNVKEIIQGTKIMRMRRQKIQKESIQKTALKEQKQSQTQEKYINANRGTLFNRNSERKMSKEIQQDNNKINTLDIKKQNQKDVDMKSQEKHQQLMRILQEIQSSAKITDQNCNIFDTNLINSQTLIKYEEKQNQEIKELQRMQKLLEEFSLHLK